ncbi:alpha/beta fold hydrolase [Streptomyces sp. NPDC002054]|uniref:alpha/beta fold hydrolase n=1 Tax=Streptomyces sp. NPDC002054 TaxID=3154663 RepID=UPI003317E33E
MGAAPGTPRLGVVLVHGFNSSPDMWDPLRRLIAADPVLDFVETLAFRYATKLWSFDPRRAIPSFDTVADSLKEYLDTESRAFGRLMLVSHSQGGLIVQRYLTRMTAEGRGGDLRRIGRIVLLACPNNGSEIALSLRRRLLRCNLQEQQLRPLNEQIAETQRAVLRDIVNADQVTAGSCPIPFSVYAGETDNIVPPASARGVFPDAAVLPGDHSGIARPTAPDHRTYTTLRRLILLTSASTEPRAEPKAEPVSSAAFPDTFEVVAAAERVSDMDDAAFRLTVVRLMRNSLAADSGFAAAYKAHPRDHLVEIVERCRSHRDAPAALAAFRDAVTLLRPDDAATADLRAVLAHLP